MGEGGHIFRRLAGGWVGGGWMVGTAELDDGETVGVGGGDNVAHLNY